MFVLLCCVFFFFFEKWAGSQNTLGKAGFEHRRINHKLCTSLKITTKSKDIKKSKALRIKSEAFVCLQCVMGYNEFIQGKAVSVLEKWRVAYYVHLI